MKKVMLLLLTILLTACKPNLKVEEDAKIKVKFHNELYGTQLVQLWNETYPENQNVIEITDDEKEADVFLVEDTKIASVIDQCLDFDPDLEIDVHESFNALINRVKSVYYPLMAKGEYYYAIDTTNNKNDFKTFEEMKNKNDFYYYDNPVFLLSLLSSDTDYFPGNNTKELNFDGKSFKQALSDYLKIRQQFDAGESKLFDRWFIEHTHASGFVTDWMQLDENEQINKSSYQIKPLPTINGHQLKTTAQSFGYVIKENTPYPNAAQMIVELMHTQKAMQFLCHDENYIPLLNEEDIEKFTFENQHIEEKANALVASMPINLVAIDETGRGAIDFLTLESTMTKINECKDVEVCIEKLDKEYQKWIETK